MGLSPGGLAVMAVDVTSAACEGQIAGIDLLAECEVIVFLFAAPVPVFACPRPGTRGASSRRLGPGPVVAGGSASQSRLNPFGILAT